MSEKTLTEVVTDLNSLKRKYHEEVSNVASVLEDAIFNEVDSLAASSSGKLHSFSWSQYTPYFMDGDPCEFGVNNEAYSIKMEFNVEPFILSNLDPALYDTDEEINKVIDAFKDATEDGYAVWHDGYDTFPNPIKEEFSELYEKVVDQIDTYGDLLSGKISSTLQQVQDDVYEERYGDHVEITFYLKDRTVSINDYEHD